MRRLRFPGRLLCASCVLLMPVTANVPKAFAEESGATYLPSSTVVYAEIGSPGDLVDEVLNHPLLKKLEQMEEYQALTEENPDYLKARAGVGIFEFVVGRDWDEAISDIGGEGLYFGIDGETEGAVVLAHAPDAGELADIRDRLIKAAKTDADRKGTDVGFEEHEYRGHPIYKTDDAIAGLFGQWVVVTNKPDLGRAVADRLLDDGGDSLASQKHYNDARAAISGDPAAWAYVDVAAMRKAGIATQLYRDKSDNPAVELLLGGVLAAMKDAPTGTAALYLEDSGLRLALNVPYKAENVPEQRAFYFGGEGLILKWSWLSRSARRRAHAARTEGSALLIDILPRRRRVLAPTKRPVR